MVSVTYLPKCCKVTVKGHANSAEYGHDLVCAAVSILIYTLAANALELKHEGYTKDVFIDLDEGDSEVSVVPKRKGKQRVKSAMTSVCFGFELLSQQYPANISYEIKT